MKVLEKPDLQKLLEMKGNLYEVIKYLKNVGYSERDISIEYKLPLHWVYIYSNGYEIKSKMLFSEMVDWYNSISEKRSSKGKKTESLKFLKIANLSYEQKIGFLTGLLSDKPVGVGNERVIEAIGVVGNKSPAEMRKFKEEYGDLGDIAYQVVSDKKGTLLAQEVYYTVNALTSVGNYDKVMVLASLLEIASKDEAKYLCWLIKKRIYLGMNTEALVSVIAKYTNTDPELLSQATLLIGKENAFALAKKGNDELKRVRVQPGKFIPTMKAKIFDSRDLNFPVRVEMKFDGQRIQLHKSGDNTVIYSNNGNIIQDNFLTNYVKTLPVNSIIAEGELVGITDQGKFANLYAFKKGEYASKVVILFDLLYLNGTVIMNKDWRKRHTKLEELKKLGISTSTSLAVNSMQEVITFYDNVINNGGEGIMIKNLDMVYYPNRRSSAWMKLKPSTDTIDAVIIKANYGKGRKSGVYSNFKIAIRHPTKKALYDIGTIGNFNEADLEMLSRRVKPLKKDMEGVTVRPEIVIEVTSYEILLSNETTSGFALRSPRLVRIRDDKTVKEIDTTEKLTKMYRLQNQEEA